MDLNHLSIPENRASNHQFSSPEGTSDSCSCAQVAGSEAQLHRLEAHLAKTEAELRLAKEREAHLVAEIRRLEAVCCPAGERALAEAEHLLQLKAEFVNNMHHELRTPLYGILGMATIGLRAEDPGKARHACQRILEAGRRLSELVENVLSFSHLDAGRRVLRSAPTSLGKLLGTVARRALAKATSKGLAFEYRRGGCPPGYCMIDGKQLNDILGHLLDNAVKFTDEGNVTLTSERDGNRLVFTVADTGIGMRVDHVRQLFRPFEQADGSTSRRFGGMGLGLALTERMVQRMGGTIRVESTLGKGSRFEVHLPYVEAAEA
ncbi:MAG: HAMP domain-containing histidine kinase [Gammaproteobacteria bacterium]|nr:HAMP domain-containing histidine kinase [Gammaproteobacteria bacterium]MBU1602029.1 HAMP domain-containing histidine kinase [Gammaproteobacteria bacterium]MBU2434006.1 HAMP domain-containing histidine kinase [Gammaproteobacteria bacterium]MBU2447830.1 HAMP domain-containing histidine kinase [Gammaproteobacteria bacterium]